MLKESNITTNQAKRLGIVKKVKKMKRMSFTRKKELKLLIHKQKKKLNLYQIELQKYGSIKR